jgi:hypothetical protein
MAIDFGFLLNYSFEKLYFCVVLTDSILKRELLFEWDSEITQAFRYWLLASEQVIYCYICGQQIGTGVGFSPNFYDFALLFVMLPNLPYSSVTASRGMPRPCPGRTFITSSFFTLGALDCDLELW